jgi:hypothetical protein
MREDPTSEKAQTICREFDRAIRTIRADEALG